MASYKRLDDERVSFLKVIFPLAGVGTRMRPHTHTKAKPLLSVAGKPGLSYFLDELKAFDVSEIICITGYLKEQIEDYFKKNCKIKARFIEQKTLDGTAGAVRLAEEFVDEPVLIIFVDAVFDADLGLIKKLKKDESGIIWAKEVEDYQRYGVCVLDKKGYIQRIVEKPKEPISKLANIGLYYIKDYKLLFEGIKHVFDKKMSLKGEYYLTDAFEYMIDHGAKIICPPVAGWYDYGKPETLLESNRELLKKGRNKVIKAENTVFIPPVNIADDVKIKDSVIGPFVSIAAGTTITHCIIKDSVIGSKTVITDASMEASIIGDHAEVVGSFQELNVGDHSVVRFANKGKKE
jgi:glucose-1-phosphate thymidylyltransferase